jgi:hypothetical protein
MKVDVNNALTIIMGLLAVIGSIYRLAQVEANIISKINNLDKKVDVHLTEYSEKKQFVDYRLNANEKLIEHKFNRLAGWIKQITGFLGKESNFHIRDDQF